MIYCSQKNFKEVMNLNKNEEKINKLLKKLKKLDNEQLMFIAGATNAFYLTQQKDNALEKTKVE